MAAERGGELVTLRAPSRSGTYGLEGPAGVEVRTVRRPPLPARAADLPEQVLLPIDLRRARADLVHALSIYRAALAPGVPSVVSVHDVAPLMWPEHYLRSGRLHRLLYRAARRAAVVLTISEAAGADVARHLGLPPERVVTTPLAADAAFVPTETPSGRPRPLPAVRGRPGQPRLAQERGRPAGGVRALAA